MSALAIRLELDRFELESLTFSYALGGMDLTAILRLGFQLTTACS